VPPISYDDELCAAPDADAGASAGVVTVDGPSASFTLRPGDPARLLADGCTTIEMRIVHPTISLGEGGVYGLVSARGGLPYVSVRGGWLEILHATTLYSHGYLFTIQNAGCQTVTDTCGDCGYQDLASCDITVTTAAVTPDSKPGGLDPASVDQLFSLDSRYDAFAVTAAGNGWVAVRGLGFFIGNVDGTKSPPQPTGLMGGVDIVTGFGVANIDFDYFDAQVIGATGTTTIGPHAIAWTIDDVGTVNTHCYDGGCRDVFDFDVAATVSDARSRVPAIVSYR
jgi:hypothetical protein